MIAAARFAKFEFAPWPIKTMAKLGTYAIVAAMPMNEIAIMYDGYYAMIDRYCAEVKKVGELTTQLAAERKRADEAMLRESKHNADAAALGRRAAAAEERAAVLQRDAEESLAKRLLAEAEQYRESTNAR